MAMFSVDNAKMLKRINRQLVNIVETKQCVKPKCDYIVEKVAIHGRRSI